MLAAFEIGLHKLSATVARATSGRSDWLERLRTGVVAFLGFLDDEPAWGRLLIYRAPLIAGPPAVSCSARVDSVLTLLLDEAAPPGTDSFTPQPRLASELVIGGAVSVIRSRMRNGYCASYVELAPQLMSFIVRPYLGSEAARRELASGTVVATVPHAATTKGLPARLPHRTTLVLQAIARAPRSSNRGVAGSAGLADEGQTSKLLKRLRDRELIENVGRGHAWGGPNEWLLTPYGEMVLANVARSAAARASSPRATPSRTRTARRPA